MCIIIAKPAGIKMPSTDILSNCFTNNPDGAGIMLSAKGKVHGFKGLMTMDSVEFQLQKLEKTFGSLDKLPVVMHFRIGTHGANIAANTHPFPVVGSYKAMRRLEWTADLGMAHNGIISALSSHSDIKTQNVSDTMAFIHHVVNPIAKASNIMQNDKILKALLIASGSKLAFLNGEGTLKVLGDFVMNDGVYYSNKTFKETRWSYASLGYNAGWDDWDYASWNTHEKKWEKKRGEKPRLSNDDEKYLRESLALEYGLFELGNNVIIDCERYKSSPSKVYYAIDEGDGTLLCWDEEEYEWVVSGYSNDYVNVLIDGEPLYHS